MVSELLRLDVGRVVGEGLLGMDVGGSGKWGGEVGRRVGWTTQVVVGMGTMAGLEVGLDADYRGGRWIWWGKVRGF